MLDAQLELKLSQEKNERYTEDKTNLVNTVIRSADIVSVLHLFCCRRQESVSC